MTRHACLGLTLAVAALASLVLAPASFAGITTNQTVAKSGTIVTWTGGTANTGTDPNADVTTMSEPTTGSVTIATTSGTITITADPNEDCGYDNVGQTSVTCTSTTQVAGDAGPGDDSVNASATNALTSIFLSTLSGGTGNDTLTGGGANDTIDGGDGDDTINGRDGDDTLTGGADNDRIKGDNDNDTIDGGVGDDDVKGGNGNDSVSGGDGNDSEVAGGNGKDVVNGGDGNDYMRGGPDDDTLNGGPGNDYMYGACDIGCDSSVETDADTLNGDAGYDSLNGEGDNDVINGGDDADFADGGDGNDVINGDGGDDRGGCINSLNSHAELFFCGGLYGGEGNDTIDGGEGDDYIAGYYANYLYAAATPDGKIADADHLSGDSGNDEIYGDFDNDVIDAGDGIDYVEGGYGDDNISGGPGNDAYIEGYPYVSGGLQGGEGNDTIDGGNGIDSIDGDNGDDTITGGPGDDAFHYISNACPPAAAVDSCTSWIYGGLWGDNDNDTMDGGEGRDHVWGGDGDDHVNGGPGDDTYQNWNAGNTDGYGGAPGVYGGDGNDVLHGGDGSDYLEGGWDSDTTIGDAGDDEVLEWDDGSPDNANGGTGIDDLIYESCCYGSPVTLTLDDQADDGEAENPDFKDSGDPGNNFGSELDNVVFDPNCNSNCSDGTTVTSPAKIVGTGGANLLYGAEGDDDITGGNGADYMSGSAGDDTFHARDGYPDYIDCGLGVDTAVVDQFDTVHNCENVDPANVASAFDTSKPAPVPPTPPAPPAVVPSGNRDTTPPSVTLNSKTTFTADQLALGVKVTAICSEDCALNLRLLAQQSSGGATFSRAKGYNVVVGRRSVGFGKSKRNIRVRPCERKQGGPQSQACVKRFKKALNARLKKTGKVTMKLRAVTTDRAGNRSTKVKTITIKRK